jgi:hypothetical protein
VTLGGLGAPVATWSGDPASDSVPHSEGLLLAEIAVELGLSKELDIPPAA